MKSFVQFIRTLHENRYSSTIKKLVADNVPCAVFAPFYTGGAGAKRDLITQLRDRGINLKYLFSVESEEIQNPLEGIEVMTIDAPPPQKIRNRSLSSSYITRTLT